MLHAGQREWIDSPFLTLLRNRNGIRRGTGLNAILMFYICNPSRSPFFSFIPKNPLYLPQCPYPNAPRRMRIRRMCISQTLLFFLFFELALAIDSLEGEQIVCGGYALCFVTGWWVPYGELLPRGWKHDAEMHFSPTKELSSERLDGSNTR